MNNQLSWQEHTVQKKLTKDRDVISKLTSYAPVSLLWDFYFSRLLGIPIYDMVCNKSYMKKFCSQVRQKIQV